MAGTTTAAPEVAFNDHHDFLAAMAAQDERRREPSNNDTELDDEALFKSVSRNNIDEGTRSGYQSSTKRLIMWLFESEEHRNILHEECITTLQVIHDDQTIPQKKKTAKLNAKALQYVKKASQDFHPIKLSDLSVKIFVHFLFSRAKVRNDGSKFLSKSGYGTYRSALKDLYKECAVDMEKSYETELSLMYKCLNRSYQEEKKEKGGRMTEGKDPMSFALYQKLCQWMLEDKDSNAIFAHAFLTLTWNLVCRSKNTVFIHRNHISWSADSLTVQFAHMKTDMEGFEAAVKRHIYANPHNVAICCPTALAKYLLFCPKRTDDMLFDENSYQRFRKYLKDLVDAHADELKRMGVDPENIGVHSIRKGAATYCCSGTTAAPHIAVQFAIVLGGQWVR